MVVLYVISSSVLLAAVHTVLPLQATSHPVQSGALLPSMSVPTNVALVQKDWQNRELVEIVELNILQIASFLNQFDVTMRYKLATLNERINKLERALDYCEIAVKTTIGGPEA